MWNGRKSTGNGHPHLWALGGALLHDAWMVRAWPDSLERHRALQLQAGTLR